MKQYIIGKVVDPEIKIDANNIRIFIFGLYSHRESKEFSVPESFRDSESQALTSNPLFQRVCDLNDGDYIIALVRNSVSVKGSYVNTWLENVHFMDEMCVDVLTSCLRS